MGVCNSTSNSKEIKPNQSSQEKNEMDEKTQIINRRASKSNGLVKRSNPNSTISGVTNGVVIKHINDINGDAVKIDNCKNSTVVILDYSAQIIVYQCTDCNFFFAPCVGSVNIRKSENIRIISASGQFRVSDVSNCKASIYVSSQPVVERVKDFQLGCFFFMYTELADLFLKAELSVWNNSWSEFYDFTPGEDKSKSITFFNAKEDQDFIAFFLNTLKDQEINVDQYFPVPYTCGQSINFTSSHKNLLVFFRESHIDKNKIYELLSQDCLDSFHCSLIKTVHFDNRLNEDITKIVQTQLKRKNKSEKADFFSEKIQFSNLSKSTTTGNFIRKNSQTPNNKFVLLWLVNESDNLEEFIDVIENEVENCLTVLDEDVGAMNELIKKIFKNYSL